MQYYILMNHWSSLVRDFKDSERDHNQEHYSSERLALGILDYIRYTSIRQYNKFQMRRGEEFERMVEFLKSREHNADAMDRFFNNEVLWETTLELAEQ